MKFYPLTFTPILKDRIWGGKKLNTYLNKPLVSETTGESWEISTVPGDVSVVNNGVLKGKNINEIIELYPDDILGKSVVARFGKQFPLLFKFIDAKEDLSIQLHPNDELARERHNSFGKTEMWYVMQADESSRLVVGFKKDSNKEEYLQELNNKEKTGLLKRCAQIFEIEIDTEQLKILSDNLIGFPEQIFYCINFIESTSVKEAIYQIEIIQDYNKENFRRIVDEIEKDMIVWQRVMGKTLKAWQTGEIYR